MQLRAHGLIQICLLWTMPLPFLLLLTPEIYLQKEVMSECTLVVFWPPNHPFTLSFVTALISQLKVYLFPSPSSSSNMCALGKADSSTSSRHVTLNWLIRVISFLGHSDLFQWSPWSQWDMKEIYCVAMSRHYGIKREELHDNHTNIEEDRCEQTGKPCPNDIVKAFSSSCAWECLGL